MIPYLGWKIYEMTLEYLVVTESKKTVKDKWIMSEGYRSEPRGNLLAKFETICTWKRIMNAIDCKRLSI